MPGTGRSRAQAGGARAWFTIGPRIAISVDRYTERLAEAGIEPSVGSVGDSYDNALAETINGLFKAEVIHRRGPWRSFEAVEYATLEWVDWFNNRRLLEPIGNIPPAEAEANFYAALERSDMAA
jgi:putative transposase